MTKPGTRDRLIQAMASGMQRRGMHGVGLTELLAEADAPKGVLYHHFPGGKDELTEQAIVATVQHICGLLDQAFDTGQSPWAALQQWMRAAERSLESSGFERGCPLATVALESGPADTAIRAALAQGFKSIRSRIASALMTQGMPRARATSLAALVVAAYEGGLIQARVAGSVEPLRQVRKALAPLLDDPGSAA